MALVERLVYTRPWRTVAGAFFVGAGLALDHRVRRSLVLSGLQLVRAIAVERAKQYVRALEGEEQLAYARA
jgi:hypothetical protein